MAFLLMSLVSAALSAALFFRASRGPARTVAAALMLASAGFLIVPVLKILLTGVSLTFVLPLWPAFGLDMDPIAALFLLVLAVAVGLNTLLVLRPSAKKNGRQARVRNGEWARPVLFLLLSCLFLTRNGILIILFAEGAAIVLTIWRRESVSGGKSLARFAGFLQFGVVPVAVAILILTVRSGNPDIRSFAAVLSSLGPVVQIVSLLILLGTGAIMGLFPFHGWMEDRGFSDSPDRVLNLSLWPVLGFSLFVRLLNGWRNPFYTTVLLILALGAVTLIWAAVMSGRKKIGGSVVFGMEMAQGGLISMGLGAGLAGVLGADSYVSVLGFFGASLAVANRIYSSVVIGAAASTGTASKHSGLSVARWAALPLAGYAGLPVSGGFAGWLLIYCAFFFLSAGRMPGAAIGWAGLAVLAVSQAILIGQLREPLRTVLADKPRVRGKWIEKTSLFLGGAILALTGFLPQYASLFLVLPVFAYTGQESALTGMLSQIAGSRIFITLNTVSRFLLAFAGVALILYFIRLLVLVKRQYDREDGATGR